jgi:hypothetical protein
MSDPTPLHVAVEILKSESTGIEVLSALLTPLIAVVTVYIAIQQYRLSHWQFRNETYDRRLRIYKAVQLFLSDIVSNGPATYARNGKFYSEASEAAFLFDESVQQYVEVLYKKATELAYAREKLNPADGSTGVEGDERGRFAQDSHDLLLWFTKQFEPSQKMFKEKMGIAQ